MNRAVLLYLLLVALPAGALGWFAFRVADGELARRLAEQRASLEGDAQRLAIVLEAAFEAAVERALAEETAVTGFARAGRWLGFVPPPERADAEPSDEERRFYAISRDGGESFEHAHRNPARALNAFAFHLHRLRSPILRARLQLGAARSAQALGEKRLADAMLGALRGTANWVDTEEGVPIALAARRLLGEDASGIERLWRSRRRLAEAVADEPALLTSLDAMHRDNELFFVREAGNGEREIRMAALALPPLAVAAATRSSTLSGAASPPAPPARSTTTSSTCAKSSRRTLPRRASW